MKLTGLELGLERPNLDTGVLVTVREAFFAFNFAF